MNGIYTAASGLNAERQWLTIIGANLAAADSPGYLAVSAQFASYPTVTIARTGANPSADIGHTSWGVALTPTEDNPGDGLGVATTGRSLDVGIAGPGFLAVATPSGVQYTKDGQLFLDAAGDLVTGSGDRVLSTTGTPIHLAEGSVAISPDGAVSQNGRTTGTLGLFDLSGTLTSSPGNLYTGTVTPDHTSTVVQGALNVSGVSITDSATAMMQAETVYQGLSSLISTESTRLGQAAQLGVLA